jgi:hypothetical protein
MWWMLVVRYVALVALAVWVGGLVVGFAVSPAFWRIEGVMVGYACGAVVIVSYVTLKLVGPPPRNFSIRVGIAVVMLAVALGGRWLASATAPAAVETVLGLALLTWYVRE